MKESLSSQQARKLVLLSQRLPATKKRGTAMASTLEAIEHLGYVQVDTISVIQRAHHHTLWNRNPRYRLGHLNQLVEEKRVFEYWAHAASYLPMRDYRFSLPRKQAIASGGQDHWYERDEKAIKVVLERIKAEGPLRARDFEHVGEKPGVWQAKPAKAALEYLYMQGDLMLRPRDGFQKVYDLTERVLPEGIDTTAPDPENYARYLITRYLRANGLGRAPEMSYLVKGVKALVVETLKEMELGGEVERIRVKGQDYFALPESLALLGKSWNRSILKILSPFDNLVIQRERMSHLFEFDYQIECYLPKAKRQYGYFSLPILWGGKLVARMDCKADRKESLLHIHHLALEPGLKKIDEFAKALRGELELFLSFNECTGLKLHRTTPVSGKGTLKAELERFSE